MKTRLRLRYYCDFCKKSGASAGAMKLHEKHCTANPNRECRVCRQAVDLKTRAFDLKTWPQWFNERKPSNPSDSDILKLLRQFCQNCPACILSVIRQHHVFTGGDIIFDYKEETKLYWDERARREALHEYEY